MAPRAVGAGERRAARSRCTPSREPRATSGPGSWRGSPASRKRRRCRCWCATGAVIVERDGESETAHGGEQILARNGGAIERGPAADLRARLGVGDRRRASVRGRGPQHCRDPGVGVARDGLDGALRGRGARRGGARHDPAVEPRGRRGALRARPGAVRPAAGRQPRRRAGRRACSPSGGAERSTAAWRAAHFRTPTPLPATGRSRATAPPRA